MDPRNATDRARAGFTLAELLIVLVVIAFMAAVAIPQFGASGEQSAVEGAAQRLRGAILYAQGRSIGGVRMKVMMDPTNESFSVRDVVTGAVVAHPENASKTYSFAFTDEEATADVDLLSTTFASNQVAFNDYGVASAGGTATLRRGDATRTVWVDAFTGRVGIQ
ncbi:MAG: prepilin-type N-terminal cleavage/methylation domain-containing protein [Candidatus Methylomirabilis sp.]|nr:prepilin-type N-terminal cleavage/methylation domain-containing protein [Deltaproteobacteria bacterium]